MRVRGGVVGLLVLLAATTGPAADGATAQEVDHYVLALSWSPTYCEGADRRRERLQCDPDADRTFVVHGLWPNTRTSSPSYCETRATPPTPEIVERMLDIMPSRSLVLYQWRKHGTCSGLSAERYFDTVRRAFARVTVPGGLVAPRTDFDVRPSVLREAFERSNDGLDDDEIYVRCSRGQLDEVRVCLSPGLDFLACPNVARQRCRSRLIAIPAPE